MSVGAARTKALTCLLKALRLRCATADPWHQPMTTTHSNQPRRLHPLLLLLLVVLVGVPSLVAHGADPTPSERATARAVGRVALAQFKKGDYPAALAGFSRAHSLVGLTTTGLWLARCQEKLGKLVEASETLLEVTRMTLDASALPVHRKAQQEAATERQQLLPRLAQLTLVVSGDQDGLRFELDGRPLKAAMIGVALPVNPGKHHFEGARGEQRVDERFTLEEGEERQIELAAPAVTAAGTASATVSPTASARASAKTSAAPPPPPPPPPPLPPPPPPRDEAQGSRWQVALGWIALGLGAGGVALGGVSAALAADKLTSLEDGCNAVGECPSSLHDDVDSYDLYRTLSTTGFVAGGVLAAGGIVLLVTAPSAPSVQSSLRPLLWPGGVGVEGRF